MMLDNKNNQEDEDRIEEIKKLYDKEIINELNKSKIQVRKRWFLLIDKALKWLSKNPYKDLEHSNIFIGSRDFDEEINFVKEDYKKYQNIKNQNKYFSDVRVMLPKIYDTSKKLYPVKE